MRNFIEFYRAQLIILAISMTVAAFVLYYIYKKNPNPRFRPKVGEMCVMGLFALFACAGLAIGFGKLFHVDNDGRALSEKPEPPPIQYQDGEKFGPKKESKRTETDEEKLRKALGGD